MIVNVELSKSLFNDVYFPYLYDYKHRKEIYYGGAGSGKSVFIAQKLLVKLCASKRKALIVRKYATTQRESCLALFLSILSKWQLKKYCKINNSTLSITLPNGSELLFIGLDDPEKIKSIVDITDIWVEEATELSLEDFEQLDLRLRSQADNLQIFVSFNPVSKANWVYPMWFTGPTEDFILKTTYKDNRFLPDDYIKALEAKINTNPVYYRIYALGEFCSLDKLVFGNWRIDNFNYADIKGELIVGLDFGFVNDPTALVASIVDEDNKRIYVFKNWTDTGKTNDQIAAVIKNLGFAKSVIIADSAEPKSIEELKRAGIYRIMASKKGPDSIKHGIQKLQQYEMIIHSSCVDLITELENYSWKKDKKTGEYTNEPVDLFNHSIDALRYSLQAIEKKKLTSISKSALGL